MGKENIIFGIFAALGTTLSAYLGGWDALLKIFVFLMIADYVTGVLSAFKRKQVNSEVMFWGGIRKAAVLLVIAIAVMLDEVAGNDAPIFRMLFLYFYIAREGLSVVENLGLLGVPMPSQFKQFLEQLQKKSESGVVPNVVQTIDQTLGKPVTAAESEIIKNEVSGDV